MSPVPLPLAAVRLSRARTIASATAPLLVVARSRPEATGAKRPADVVDSESSPTVADAAVTTPEPSMSTGHARARRSLQTRMLRGSPGRLSSRQMAATAASVSVVRHGV